MAYEVELQAAIDAVQKASRLCRSVQRRLVEGVTLEKGDKSPVTVADFGAQAIVSHLLALEFPHDPLVGEEDAAALRENADMRSKVVEGVHSVLPDLNETEVLNAIDRGMYEGGGSGRHWTLDPIDGTKGFLRSDQYAVALGLIEDGEVVLGVLGCPNLPHHDGDDAPRGSLFWGVRGEGARWRGLDGGETHLLSVTDVEDPSLARFCESVEKAHSSQSDSAKVAARLGITRPPYRIDSQCKYAAVARGDASIYLRLPAKADYVEKIWDHAAGVRIVEEAGGRVSDVRGQALDFGLGRRLSSNTGVIVTNGRLHDRVVGAVREVLDV